jgi:acetylornithine deacetylase/succinyl-diaminopimelate desuccinylase-like protein
MTKRRGVCAVCLSFVVSGGLAAAPETADVNATALLLGELIRVDTTNPPGNEAKLAELLAGKFEPLGFEIDVVPTPQEGKAHFLARLRGDGSKKPVLLAAHADVVGVEREKWTFDPFAGTIEGGFVFGRGALDFKGGLAVFARAVMMLAEKRVPLSRDVIFLAEADEEGGRYSTLWLAQNHWPKIDCEFALNEGGWILKRPDGSVRYVSISTADKGAVSLVLTARGTSTHSSMPRPDNAIFRLSKALARLADHDTEPTLIPITRRFFTALARTSDPPMSTYFRNLVEGKDPALVREADREISKNVLLHAVMRNTIAPVLLNAGFRGNVIPGSAEATINFRTIPGTLTEELIREVEAVIDDPGIEVAPAGYPGLDPEGLKALMKLSQQMEPSSEDTVLYRSLASQAKKSFPEAEVTPWLFQAGTDAFAWRSRGVPVYGIYPYPIDGEDLSRMHGNDERVSVDSLGQGTELIYRTLVEVAGK